MKANPVSYYRICRYSLKCFGLIYERRLCNSVQPAAKNTAWRKEKNHRKLTTGSKEVPLYSKPAFARNFIKALKG